MGINIHVYTYYGVKTNWNDDFYTDYEEIEEQNIDIYGWNRDIPEDKQVDVLVDCMSGEYLLFGIRLYDSGDFRYCNKMNNYQELQLDISTLEQGKQKYIEIFSKLYPDRVHLLEGKWKLINIIHYT